ncbi:unnamed protein product [Gadus morhua 'NCC']
MTANPQDSPIIREAKRAVTADLEKRYTNPDLIDHLHRATALDPRFKSLPFIDEAACDQVYKGLVAEILDHEQQVEGTHAEDEDEEKLPSASALPPPQKKTAMSDLFGELFTTGEQHPKPLSAVIEGERAEENAHAFQDKEMKKHRRYQASEDPQCSESQREEEELDGKKEEQRRRAKEGVVDITKLCLTEINQEELADTPWGRELGRIRSKFVDKVSDPVIKGLLDDLWQQKVFSTEEKDSVMEGQTIRADQARCLIDMVIGKGERASQTMIDSMKKRDQHLCSTLGLMSPPAGVGCAAVVECQHKIKSHFKENSCCVFEGIAKPGHSTLLNDIYTELYITERGSGEVNKEHEVRLIETASRKSAKEGTPIKCEDIFKPLPGKYKPIRTIMTTGVAGIGKTILTHKFTLDWAEDKANQDIHFTFLFTFRDLNLLKEKEYSLVELLHHFFIETKEAGIYRYEPFQVVFILDGLDECRLPLDFQKNPIWTDVTKSTTVDVLLINLIRGKLLRSARIWITTRPAAANRIPAECVDMVTEVRGFTDQQKEEYFRKRFREETMANTIMSHIKKSRSLHIMCHIPVFCWITATVLEDFFKKSQQLEKGHLIFYEADLAECDIDIGAAAVYSGVFTQIFKEERGMYQDIVFCFVHLSIQEFLAALYVFMSFIDTGVNLLSGQPQFLWSIFSRNKGNVKLYQSAVDKALQSEDGRLDLFLRFLLGLSLETNQIVLKCLLGKTVSSSKTSQKMGSYIKKKIGGDLSTEKRINLFHCLNELNDRSLVEEIQQYLTSGRLSKESLSPAQWSALVFILLSSEEELDVFDLNKYSATEKGLLRLLPVVKASKTSL